MCGERGTCEIDMNKFTDFKWGKMVLFYYADDDETTDALGFEYKQHLAVAYGIFFAYQNKVVYYYPAS